VVMEEEGEVSPFYVFTSTVLASPLCFIPQHLFWQAYAGMEDVIQMWLESYNVYHLIDGLAMKDAWGCIMPHIILGKKNLQAILDQVKWALLEDSLEGPLLSPKMRAIRLQGGKENFVRGYNTQEPVFEHSVVNDT